MSTRYIYRLTYVWIVTSMDRDDVWPELCRAWASLDYILKREKAKQNQASDKGMDNSLHIIGSISHIEYK